MSEEKKIEWVELIRFSDCLEGEEPPNGTVTVAVSVLALREPKYSLRVGTLMGEHIRPFVQFGNSRNPDGMPPGALCELVAKAEAYIAKAQLEAFERSEKEEEERRERDRAKKSQYLANVEARRNANRAAASAAKGGKKK